MCKCVLMSPRARVGPPAILGPEIPALLAPPRGSPRYSRIHLEQQVDMYGSGLTKHLLPVKFE